MASRQRRGEPASWSADDFSPGCKLEMRPTDFQILNEAFQKRDEVLRLPDVTWNCLLEQVIREHC